MGFTLKKLVRGAVKLGKKVAPQILKATPAGALLVRAQQAAKSLGVNFRAAKKKQQPLSVQAAIMRPVLSMPIARDTSRRGAFTEDYAGAKKLRTAHKTQSPKVARALAAPRKAKRTAGKGRTPPKGGLDLKAMSAAWKRAGKPGTWIGWIKTNQIKT